MKKLLIATSNPGKLAELKQFLADVQVELVSLKDLHITDKVSEIGKTFEENALIKARFYCRLSGVPTLADDGGFEIDALGGEPGIKSHRWVDLRRESSDEELIEYAMKRMKDVPQNKRGAQLRLVLALILPNGQEFTAEQKIRGIVPLNPAKTRTKGFPYRSLLYLSKLQKFYDEQELTSKENEKYNHRRRAVEKLKPILRQLAGEK